MDASQCYPRTSLRKETLTLCLDEIRACRPFWDGIDERRFEPASALELNGLEKLEEELLLVNDCSTDLATREPDRNRGQWN